MKNPYQKALNDYQSLELQTRVENASPHELTNMLIEGALSNVCKAQGFMARAQLQKKGEHIGKALNIIEGLKTSLNHEKGGDISINLEQLYTHVQTSLLKANSTNDEVLLQHSHAILSQVHQAWQEIC